MEILYLSVGTLKMKNIIRNWQEYLKEQEEQSVATFDFDDTLSLSHWGEEEDDWVNDGPNFPMIKKIKNYINNPNIKVYVVTSRYEKHEPKSFKNPHQYSVKQFLDEHGLKVDGIYFTNGALKVEKLLELGTSIHHDDDPEEIRAAKQSGIITVVSDPYGDYSELEASMTSAEKSLNK